MGTGIGVKNTPGARFSKVQKIFRARKGIRKTASFHNL